MCCQIIYMLFLQNLVLPGIMTGNNTYISKLYKLTGYGRWRYQFQECPIPIPHKTRSKCSPRIESGVNTWPKGCDCWSIWMWQIYVHTITTKIIWSQVRRCRKLKITSLNIPNHSKLKKLLLRGNEERFKLPLHFQCLDNHNINSLNVRWLRSTMGIVSQVTLYNWLS